MKFILNALAGIWLLPLIFPFVNAQWDCPKLDPNNRDPDGIMRCPSIVDEISAWSVFRCANQQSNSWHFPSENEKMYTTNMLKCFKNSINNVNNQTSKCMMDNADKLDLQMCRYTPNDGRLPYLLIYSKPGVRDYSGIFYILRQINPSNVTVLLPHTDSDGYFNQGTACQNSNAIACFVNGHKRKAVGLGKFNDFVHSEKNLGFHAIKQFYQLFPRQAVLHMHGMKTPKIPKVLYKGRNPKFNKLFEDSVKKYTNVGTFERLGADFSVDSVVNSNNYLVTEIPSKVYGNNKFFVRNLVRDVEEWLKNN